MAATDDTIRGDIELGAPGGFFAKARNIDTRTALLFAVFVAVCATGSIVLHHEVNAQNQKTELAQTLKESNKAIAEALKEPTAAQKERDNAFIQAQKDVTQELKRATVQITIGNCMNEQAMKGRSDAREACRRIIRDMDNR